MTNTQPDQTMQNRVRSALAQIVVSDGFVASPRIVAFLTYVVDEKLAGRQEGIKARTIAQDVYDRTSSDDQQTNLVRVDAGRLRRLLNDYYTALPETPDVVISVPKGSYVPDFECTPTPAISSSPPNAKPPFLSLSKSYTAIILGGLICAILLVMFIKTTPPNVDNSQTKAERSATFEVSPERLQAMSMIQDAKQLMFPAFDAVRLSASFDLFSRAVQLDPLNGDALAGVGITTSMIAFLSPPSPAKAHRAKEGREIAQSAVERAPSSGWAHICYAWSLFVDNDVDAALRQATISRGLEPENATLQDFEALINLFSGNFEQTVRLSDPKLDGLSYSSRTPRLNALGGAQFHLGNYQASITAFQQSAALGAPVSAFATAHLVAALQANGDTQQARDLARNLNQGWPQADVRALARMLFSPNVDTEFFIAQLDAAGVTVPAP